MGGPGSGPGGWPGLPSVTKAAIAVLVQYLVRRALRTQALYTYVKVGDVSDRAQVLALQDADPALQTRCMKWELLHGAGTDLEAVMEFVVRQRPIPPSVNTAKYVGLTALMPGVTERLSADTSSESYEGLEATIQWMLDTSDEMDSGERCPECAGEYESGRPTVECTVCGYVFHKECTNVGDGGEIGWECPSCAADPDLTRDGMVRRAAQIDAIDAAWGGWSPETAVQTILKRYIDDI